jgi:hypothetical protein
MREMQSIDKMLALRDSYKGKDSKEREQRKWHSKILFCRAGRENGVVTESPL